MGVICDKASFYEILGRLLTYPTPESSEMARSCAPSAEAHCSGASAALSRFSRMLDTLGQDGREELYVATFDVNAICCLEIGFAMFGEDYKRGQFMAEMKNLYAKHGVSCGTELPDFLPNVLKLVTKLPFGDAAEITNTVTLPALDKMISGFSDPENPYRDLLALTRDVLAKDFAVRSLEASHV